MAVPIETAPKYYLCYDRRNDVETRQREPLSSVRMMTGKINLVHDLSKQSLLKAAS